MSIENPSQGTSEKIKNAEEENLTNEEKLLSSRREKLFQELSDTDKELLGKCKLKIVDYEKRREINGMVNGLEIDIYLSLNGKFFEGSVGRYQITSEQAEKIFNKYYDIAVYQNEASKSSYDSLDFDLAEEKEKMIKKDRDSLVEQLLA